MGHQWWTTCCLVSCLVGSNTLAQPKTEVLLVASYHMAGTNDRLRVDADNMLSPKRQKEISGLLDCFQKFGPTKIFVEVNTSQQAHWDSSYVLATKGILPDDGWAASESYQLGTKLAQRMKLPKAVVCVDWQQSDAANNDSPFDKLYQEYRTNVNRQQEQLKLTTDDFYNNSGKAVLAYFKKTYETIAKLPVKEALLLLNSSEFQKRIYYGTIVMTMDKNTHDVGVPIAINNLVRNLQIYTNIIQHITATDRRVMIIYGSGHTESLRDLFKGNPQIKLVSFADVVK